MHIENTKPDTGSTRGPWLVLSVLEVEDCNDDEHVLVSHVVMSEHADETGADTARRRRETLFPDGDFIVLHREELRSLS